MGFVDPVRLCAACLVPTKAEKEFFDEQLKSLFDGELREIPDFILQSSTFIFWSRTTFLNSVQSKAL